MEQRLFGEGRQLDHYLAVRSAIVKAWAADMRRHLPERDCIVNSDVMEAAGGSAALVSRTWHFLNLHGFINFGFAGQPPSERPPKSALEEVAEQTEAAAPKVRRSGSLHFSSPAATRLLEHFSSPCTIPPP